MEGGWSQNFNQRGVKENKYKRQKNINLEES